MPAGMMACPKFSSAEAFVCWKRKEILSAQVDWKRSVSTAVFLSSIAWSRRTRRITRRDPIPWRNTTWNHLANSRQQINKTTWTLARTQYRITATTLLCNLLETIAVNSIQLPRGERNQFVFTSVQLICLWQNDQP